MKVRKSLRSLKNKPGAQVVRRRGKVYVINKKEPRSTRAILSDSFHRSAARSQLHSMWDVAGFALPRVGSAAWIGAWRMLMWNYNLVFRGSTCSGEPKSLPALLIMATTISSVLASVMAQNIVALRVVCVVTGV